MDSSLFTDQKTGELIPLAQPRQDWAFIPEPLPPRWSFDPQLWPLLAEAKEALGTLNGIGQTLRDPLLLLTPLQSREAIASSNIEGTFVTPEELLLYGLDPKEPRAGDEQSADWKEVFNYYEALKHGCQLLETLPICHRLIKEMHTILMQGVRGRNKGPGEYRRWQVQIGSNGRFIPPPAPEALHLMNDLERYANADDPRFDPLVRAFIVHYQFEAIHPFGDGNGRIGRLLLSLMIYNWQGHSKPWLYLSAFFETYKDEYMQNLFNVSACGNWTAWIEFCLRGTIVQANDSIRRCREFNRLHAEFHRRVPKPTARTHQLIDHLFLSPVVSITSVAKSFEINYRTAQKELERLVNCEILTEMSGRKQRSFCAQEIFQIAFGELEQIPRLSSDMTNNDVSATPMPGTDAIEKTS